MTASLDLILIRHGNTFNPGEEPVWIGRRSDLPLAEAADGQAGACAAALAAAGLAPAVFYCGPLRRTREFAALVAARLRAAAPLRVDVRLDELDYGAWSGLSKREVIGRFGEEDLLAWESACVWPEGAGWSGSEEETAAEVRAFADDLLAAAENESCAAAVSSNGRLRYFLKLVDGAFAEAVRRRSFSVRTGNLCWLRHDGGAFRLAGWNIDPREFQRVVNGRMVWGGPALGK